MSALGAMPPKVDKTGKPTKGPPKAVKRKAEDGLKYSEAHKEVFGTGTDNPKELKAALLHIAAGIEQRHPRWTQKNKEKEFTKITGGFTYTIIRKYQAELRANNNFLYDADTKGRKTPKLTDKAEFEFLFEWVLEKVEAAKKGGFLTLKILSEALWAEKQLKVTFSELTSALHMLGFKYCRRKALYSSRRDSEAVQMALKRHCQWVRERVTKVGDRWRFTEGAGVCFQDESWVHASDFRLESWCLEGDATCDLGGGSGPRIALLDTIFSFQFATDTRKHWNTGRKTGDTKARHGGKNYHGNCTGELIAEYFGDYVFTHGPLTALCDNCSTHHSFEENLKDFKYEDLWAWVIEEEADNAERKEFQKEVKKWDKLPEREARRECMKWIRAKNLRTRKLEGLAAIFNCKVRYLPPYHPETNPIEYLWCRLKKLFRDQPLPLTWEERLRRSYEKIDEAFIDSQIDRSIRWCLAKDALFRKAGLVQKKLPEIALAAIEDSDED